jgi:flagellar hook-associated protein 3 FlgL
MRISTANAYEAGIDTLGKRQTELSQSQERLTSGKRVAKASDDPAAAARAERALAGALRSETSQRAVDASRSAMSQSESALGDADDLLQSARETMVAAGNATYTDAERAGLATKLRTIREQLLQVANRSDGAGGYLFAGQGATTAPFVDAAGGVQYQAAAGQLRTEQGVDLPLSVDGRAAWMTARTGNGVFQTSAGAGVTQAWIDNGQVSNPAALTGSTYTLQFSVSGGATTYAVLKDGVATAVTAAPYTSGQAITVDGMSFTISGNPANGNQFTAQPSSPSLSVFDTLDRAIGELASTGRSGAQIAQATTNNLRDIDSSMAGLQRARAAAGESLTRADNETSRLETQRVASLADRSNAEDLDMVHGISEFQTQQTGYDAALKSYSMVQRLSLFQYLNG